MFPTKWSHGWYQDPGELYPIPYLAQTQPSREPWTTPFVTQGGNEQPHPDSVLDCWGEVWHLRQQLESELHRRDTRLRELEERLAELDQKLAYLEKFVSMRNEKLEGLERRIEKIEKRLPGTVGDNQSCTSSKTNEAETKIKEKEQKELLEFLDSFYVTGDKPSMSDGAPKRSKTDAIPNVAPVLQRSSDLYLFGGFELNGLCRNTVERYKPNEKQWKKVGTLPSDRFLGYATALECKDGNAFLFSAFPFDKTHRNSIFKFNAFANKDEAWTELNSRLSLCLASYARLGESIYVVGGYEYDDPIAFSRSCYPFPSDINSVEISSTTKLFDPGHQFWALTRSVTEPKICPVTISVDENVLYTLGGLALRKDGQHLMPSNTVERFDHREGLWKPIAIMHERRSFFNAVVLDSTSILAISGICSEINSISRLNAESSNSLEQYDARNNQWMQFSQTSINRCCFTAHRLNGDEVFVIGGMTRSSESKNASKAMGMAVYDLQRKEWTETYAGLTGKRFGHASCVI